MKAVVLIGCGNIGFRHLQALCAMTVSAEITVIEPNPALQDRILTQFSESSSSGHRFVLATALPTAARSFDLAVVATTATHRRAAIEELLDHHEVSVMILEKVLFQTTTDLEAVGALLERRGVNTFVNCGRRTFPGYQAVREYVAGAESVHLTVRGQSLGLASNAVHFLDLAEYLNDAPLVDLDVAGLRPGSIPGKRPGSIEIFGTISAQLANGARLVVESLDADPVQIQILAESGASSFHIDEVARTIGADGAAPVPFVSQNVSETPEIYQDAIVSGHCVLTPYHDSKRQHRFMLNALRDHLGLSNVDDAPCPIS